MCKSRPGRGLPLDGILADLGRGRSGRLKGLKKKFRRELNLSPRGDTHPMGRSMFRIGSRALQSNQDEIDQGDQRGPDAGGDQDVVGPDIGLRIERWWVGFSGHFRALGQRGPAFCEADHIWRNLFNCMVPGNGLVTSGFVVSGLAAVFGTGAKEQVMGQQFQPWRSGNGQNSWLSKLVDAMEKFSRPEYRAAACDPLLLAAVAAQLARPASPYAHSASRFGLRN
jgi:hypothetical protein